MDLFCVHVREQRSLKMDLSLSHNLTNICFKLNVSFFGFLGTLLNKNCYSSVCVCVVDRERGRGRNFDLILKIFLYRIPFILSENHHHHHSSWEDSI